MAHYYVRDGATTGTATGDGGRYASAKTATDTWAAAFSATTEYYSSIEAATNATTPVAGGDIIYVASDHNHDYTTDPVITGPANNNEPAIIISVDVNNVGQELAGAIESTSNNQQFSWWEMWTIKSMHLKSYRNFQMLGGGLITLEDCEITLLNAAYDIITSTWTTAVFRDCTINFTVHASSQLVLYSRSSMKLYGCLVTGGTSSSYIFDPSDGTTIYAEGCDFSDFGTYVVDSTANGPAEVIIKNCEMGSYTSIYDTSTNQSGGEWCLLTGSASSSAAAEYQYAYAWRANLVEDATNIYRDGSTAFPSGQKISLRADTSADCGITEPFVFDLPTRFIELSDTASDTISIYILTSSTLDDNEVWATLYYPDGTNKHVTNTVKSRNTDILSAGTTLTTNTEAWTGRTSENRYQIDLATSGDVGADGVPLIRIGLAIASATVYFCPTLGLS